MNYGLAKEIYNEAWCIDFGSISTFKNLLRNIRSASHISEDKANKFMLAKVFDSGITLAKTSSPNASSKKEKTISITNIDGPITKNGGESSFGMKELSDNLMSADNDESVLGHFFIVDSPGGSVSGMQYMQQTIGSLKKPTVAIIERSGMAASAAYGIAASTNYIFAEDANSQMGSIGVISGAAGVPNGKKNGNGEVEYLIYASTAPDKNKAEEDAINNADTSGLQKRANSLHAEFKASTRASRPLIMDSQMTGKMYPASEVIGTMVDAIGSKNDAINKILELSKQKNNFNPLNNNQNKAMTAAELLAQHPTVHAEILAAGRTAGVTAGIEAEQDRVNTWMAYHEIDSEAVTKGIASGKTVSSAEQAQFLVKAAKGSSLEAIKRDSTGAIIPAEAVTEIAVEKTAKQIADEKEFSLTFPALVKKGITLEKYNASKINAN